MMHWYTWYTWSQAVGLTYDQKIQEIESYCQGKPFEVLIDDFHIVDNMTAGTGEGEDANFSKVQSAILDLAYNKLIFKTPISWVIFCTLKANVFFSEEAHAIGIAANTQHCCSQSTSFSP